jgi:hypothetical protein
MASWKQQALIEAPVAEVWRLLCDPERASDVIAVTGGPARIEKGSIYESPPGDPSG